MVLFTFLCLAAVAFALYRLTAALRRSWRQGGDTLDRIRCEDQAPADTLPRRIEDMPHHPEQVREIGDDAADDTYADIAEQLMEDGMFEIVERLGWLE